MSAANVDHDWTIRKDRYLRRLSALKELLRISRKSYLSGLDSSLETCKSGRQESHWMSASMKWQGLPAAWLKDGTEEAQHKLDEALEEMDEYLEENRRSVDPELE
eukprot:TRINITY_DN32862_c0_g3_i2.p2 TRINITY_DN32862_c0_g3~~TRINITY_DN32862_c0_g3_i2.p2  ORF type:complete len:105 (+),score=17.94 TRINITY_DN32862_c0_g3_i2:526-840(+)